MTAQITDRFTWRGRRVYDIARSGKPLFDPASLGIRLERGSTCCYRGFVAHYDVWDDVKSDPLAGDPRTLLRLKALYLNPEDIHTLPPLMFGGPLEILEKPDPNEDEVLGEDSFMACIFPCRYTLCPEPVPYSGGLLLGSSFISKSAVNQGFPSVWQYRKVYELVFREGVLMEEHDRSPVVAARRREKRGEPPCFDSEEDSKAWMAGALSLEYNPDLFMY